MQEKQGGFQVVYDYRIEDGIVIFEFMGDRVNSISSKTLKGLVEAIDRVNSEDDLKGIILTGAGKYFSGGFDLNEFTSFSGPQAIRDWFNFEEEAMLKLFTCSKPVIAAINGHATAGGMICAMATDWRIAIDSPKIKVGMTEIKIGLGLTPAEAGLMRWGLDTEKNYRDIIFKGELITVNEALSRGIFDELVEDQAVLMEKAKAKVTALIDTPGRPFILLKKAHRRVAAMQIEEHLREYDMETLVKSFTDDAIVGTLKMVKQAIGI